MIKYGAIFRMLAILSAGGLMYSIFAFITSGLNVFFLISAVSCILWGRIAIGGIIEEYKEEQEESK